MLTSGMDVRAVGIEEVVARNGDDVAVVVVLVPELHNHWVPGASEYFQNDEIVT